MSIPRSLLAILGGAPVPPGRTGVAVSTRKLILTALITGLAILVAFAVQVVIAT